MTEGMCGLDSLMKKQIRSYEVRILQDLFRSQGLKNTLDGVPSVVNILKHHLERQGCVKNVR